MKIKFVTAILILLIAACSVTQHLQPTAADLVVAQQHIPGITLKELQDGYKIYVTNCSGCHSLHNPKEYTAGQWKPILSEMFEKAKMHDTKQNELVTSYLIAKSRADGDKIK